MKILSRAKSAIGRVLALEVERREGVFVSRPVLNGKAWYDWAVRHGVPNPTPAEEMHVTIVHSKTKDVKMVLDAEPMSIRTIGTYEDPGHFVLLGPNEDVLTFCFAAWPLHHRHWAWISNGAESSWPTYRPHLTLGKDAADYELPDAALEDAPREIILGGEQIADVKNDDADSNPEGDTGDAARVLTVSDEVRKFATDFLNSTDGAKLSAIERLGLMDVAQGHVTRGVAGRLGAQNWASAELKALVTAPKEKPAERTMDVNVEIKRIPEDISRKGLDFKPNEAERMIVGIANVTTVGGDLVVDAHDTSFTTRAVTEWLRGCIRAQRGVDFDHDGPECMEIVQGFVLSDDVQRALGIDLGFELALVEVHVPADSDWAEVQDGDWMFSIRGTFAYEEVDV